MKPLLAVLIVGNLAFAGLYIHERGKRSVIAEKTVTVEKRVEVPKEVIKEVPVEKIVEKRVEVPVEVVKEVPAKIPVEYEQAMERWNRLAAAKPVSDVKELFRGIDSVNLSVDLSGKAKVSMDLAEFRTKLELSLRRNGLKIDPKSRWILSCVVSGLDQKFRNGGEMKGMVFMIDVALREEVWLARAEGWQFASVPIWTDGFFGYVGYEDCQTFLTTSATDRLDKFCNEWLEMNPRR